jgi:exonuclease III
LNTSQTDNLPFGDDISEPHDGETIIFHNINGIKDMTNWFQILMTMTELNIDIFGFVEINQKMDNGKKFQWMDQIRKHFYYSQTTHSESKLHYQTKYKPGGTMLTITGKWQSRVLDQGQDPRGLGQWSYLQLSSKKKSMVIITAYRPCVSNGPTTAWTQQWLLLREEGITDPDPVREFHKDLEKQLMQWKEEGKEILLLIDANEPVGGKPDGLTSIIGKAGLTDLVRHCHPHDDDINTHARGSKQIDFIFGSPKIRQHCTRAGILPFGYGYQSDHRALFIKIQIGDILSTSVSPMDSITAWKPIQATPKERKIFLEEVDRLLQNQNLYERLRKLASLTNGEWNNEATEEYELCDKRMIESLIIAETKTKKTKTTCICSSS